MIADKDNHQWTQHACQHDRYQSFGNPRVGDAVPLVLVAVQKAISVTKLAKAPQFSGCELPRTKVIVGKGNNRTEVLPRQVHVELVEEEWDAGMEQHPEIQRPVRDVGYFLLLRVNRNVPIELDVV